MKRALVRAYIWISILTILGICGYFFYELYALRADTRTRTAGAFVQLSGRTAELWQTKSVDEAGRELSALIAEHRDGDAPLFLSVYRIEEGVDYLWAIDDRFLPEVGSRSSNPVIRSNDLVHIRYSRSFQLPDGDRRIVTALYPAIEREEFFPILSRTLLAFLVFAASALLVAIVSLIARPKRRPRKTVPPHATEDQHEPPARSAIHGPETQRSETTGLNPESVLERRVTLELERAGYHEQDLSLALFEFTRGKKGDEQYHRNAQAVLSFFTFEDLCFEYGKNGIVVVFPNTGLSETLRQIERFQQYFWNERAGWGISDVEFRCGVSSRNGRLVEGARVLGECRTALGRASSTSGRIVGFRPDPDRYREYLSSR